MQPGTQLNHYRIVAPLGEGGMGHVYRAEDTRLRRQVAVKVLPPDLGADPERLARLEREAQLLAQLEHPNVAGVYGLEEADGTRFLVMQLVEGETLADRLAAGRMPVAEALSVARQIAEGLEAAHERGIVHRDLKPANVMVAPDGTVKVLDFGLAKAFEGSAVSSPNLTASPTVLAATQAGVILGTAAYMSPEQARGRAVDKRTDIWAFGCVLWEMLSGAQAFGGETVTDILAAIVHREPDIESLPASVPWRARELVRRCLQKNPTQRLRDIGDARIALQAAADEPGGLTAASGAAGRRLRPGQIAAGLAVGALLAGGLLSSRSPGGGPDAALRRFVLDSPAELEFTDRSPRLSPDGRKVVFSAGGQLWLRDLAEIESRPLAGTEDATYPFWSPDSEKIGFVAEGALWRLAIAGGSRTAVTRVGEVEGAVWAPDGFIYFGDDPDIARVPELGGDAVVVVDITKVRDGDGLDLHDPYLLPDGVSMLYRFHATNEPGTVMLWDGNTSRALLQGTGNEVFGEPIYSPTGHVLYNRLGEGVSNPGLWAVPFDADSLQLDGEPFLVAPAQFGASLAAGALLTATGTAGSVLDIDMTWVSLDGSGEMVAVPTSLAVGASRVALSPDGSRFVMTVSTEGNADLWMIDERGAATRLTSDPERDKNPTWDAASGRVFYTRELETEEIWARPVDGSSGAERIVAPGADPAVSPDGRYLAFTRDRDLWALDLQAGDEPRRLAETPHREALPAISPDGARIAYTSNESGRPEIHVRTFPDGADRQVVSTNGGYNAKWGPDGRELYFMSDGNILKARLDGSRFGVPEFVLSASVRGMSQLLIGRLVDFAISPQGDRILLPARRTANQGAARLILTQNWWSEFAGRR